VIDSFAAQLPSGHAPKLGVYDRQELLEGVRVASAPIDEQARDI
jgi:hypothetical protein